MFRKAMFVIIILALLTACTTTKATPTQTPLPPTSTIPPPTATLQPTDTPQAALAESPHPQARALAHFLYIPQTNQALLYGGMLSTTMGATITEAWLFDPQTLQWAVGPSLPLGCGYGSPAVYDTHAERILLYCPGSMLGANIKVWEYDTNSPWIWTDRQAANTPFGSASVRMAYDAESQKSIIIGGVNFETWEQFNETWAYDYTGNAWTKMAPKTQPPGLYAHAMAYDSESDRVILWGGYIWDGVASNGDWLGKAPENRVWAYDYNTDTWESFPVTNGPELPRFKQLLQSVQAEYIPDLDRTFFYWDDQLWSYDYNHDAWEKAKGDVLSGAGSRMMHSMVYLPSIQRLLVFGGATMGVDYWDLTFNDDTWLYDPKTGYWTQVEQ